MSSYINELVAARISTWIPSLGQCKEAAGKKQRRVKREMTTSGHTEQDHSTVQNRGITPTPDRDFDSMKIEEGESDGFKFPETAGRRKSTYIQIGSPRSLKEHLSLPSNPS